LLRRGVLNGTVRPPPAQGGNAGQGERYRVSNDRRREPMTGATEIDATTGATEIYVSGRECKVPGSVVRYGQVVKIWNELHEAEGKHIIGTPGIDYENDAKGESGVLLPDKQVEVKDGTSFSVDPEHVS